VLRLFTRGCTSVKEERAVNLAISTLTLDELGGISEPDLGTGQISPVNLSHEVPRCEDMWSKWIKGKTVDATVHPQDCDRGRNMRRRPGNTGPVLACICLVARAYASVMSTKTSYRAILRELYKAVCIFPHLISCFLSLYISSQLAPGPYEVGRLRRTYVVFSRLPSPVTLTTTPKMSSHSYILSACTR
jgi:hypothetical protein